MKKKVTSPITRVKKSRAAYFLPQIGSFGRLGQTVLPLKKLKLKLEYTEGEFSKHYVTIYNILVSFRLWCYLSPIQISIKHKNKFQSSRKLIARNSI